MGAGKTIGIIFLILLIPVGIIGADLYMTYNTVQNTDFNDTFSEPSYSISDDNSTLTVEIEVDLPKAGFIPKGVIIELEAEFNDTTITEEESMNLGEEDTLQVEFKLSQDQKEALKRGESLTAKLTADITPTVLGFSLGQLEQTVDLGEKTVQR